MNIIESTFKYSSWFYLFFSVYKKIRTLESKSSKVEKISITMLLNDFLEIKKNSVVFTPVVFPELDSDRDKEGKKIRQHECRRSLTTERIKISPGIFLYRFPFVYVTTASSASRISTLIANNIELYASKRSNQIPRRHGLEARYFSISKLPPRIEVIDKRLQR